MIDFGWIHPNNRTPVVKQISEDLILGMPDFNLIGGTYTYQPKVCLWDCVKAVTSKHLSCMKQLAGSCVGQGKAKAEWYLMYADIIKRGDWELAIMPYEPYGYSASRVCAGISGSEDGSTGAGGAEAAKKYGVLSSEFPGLPKWKSYSNTVEWPGQLDKSWGMGPPDNKYITEGRKHLVKTTALVKNVDQVIDALQNYYPITTASSWGGRDKCPVVEGVLLNSRTGEWMHQQMIAGFWDHPKLGQIFNINNSWGESFHGDNKVDDSPPGSYWVKRKDVEFMIAARDSFVYSQFDGFQIALLPPEAFKLI